MASIRTLAPTDSCASAARWRPGGRGGRGGAGSSGLEDFEDRGDELSVVLKTPPYVARSNVVRA